MGRRRRAPLWFLLLVTVAGAVALRQLNAALEPPLARSPVADQVQVAFLGFLILVGELIWKGLEVAGRVTLTALAWSVKALWIFASSTYNGLKAIGVVLRDGLKASWEFLRTTYDTVLKPAWTTFWRWFDKFRRWHDDTFGPVLKFLRDLRDTLLDFWKTYVRPWLDLIDVTRRALRVLGSLGLQWARELDRQLADLEARIERPFRLLLAKVNEVINLVNRVVTLDGLFQRLALVRSLERDMRYAWRAAVNWRVDPVTDAHTEEQQRQLNSRSLSEVIGHTTAALVDDAGPYAEWAKEMATLIGPLHP